MNESCCRLLWQFTYIPLASYSALVNRSGVPIGVALHAVGVLVCYMM